MKLSEKFEKYSNHYMGIAKDPYMLGLSFAVAACALPFSATVSAVAVAAPFVYAGVSAACRIASQSLELSGR